MGGSAPYPNTSDELTTPKDTTTPIPERLQPLLWPAYRAFDLKLGVNDPRKNPTPADWARWRRERNEASVARLRSSVEPGTWTEADLVQAVAFIEQLWDAGSDLYEESPSARGSDLARRFPGAPHAMCNSLLGYLGATRH